LFLYAWRLPVTYQFGRYIIPAMPVYFLLSLAGMGLAIKTMPDRFPLRILGKVWVISTSAVLFLYWLIGASAYGQSVAVIESEMVRSARWVAENTDPQALIAAHDIGALGYFGGRQILDLAGLVSPEVIPFIRDEQRLEAYLDQQRADFLVTFPGWYPRLSRQAEMVFTTQASYSPAFGGENMAVYRWLAP
jgi:hypothetical protein